MCYFAGLDVSLRSVSICVIDGVGKIALERTVPFEIETVLYLSTRAKRANRANRTIISGL